MSGQLHASVTLDQVPIVEEDKWPQSRSGYGDKDKKSIPFANLPGIETLSYNSQPS